ncbi:hypothetical protein [Bradyrhizobium sp. G127]|jgi:hypothetical protein|uniref:hypothetical protein n=1 Tax=Bradyrhizobium sp. G127 TaxID=2904800 RepID=UPI001F1A0FDC|nr:hypothetical protein [Bradyrhizobium sp. G127]MCF2523326.1 hypothetical protein [Bradyrhizobium sp. G127]
MRRSQRLIAATVLASISIALAGCSSGNFDPTDLMDWFDTKKKLPGERKPVFPEGVPGVEQGVPKDLYKGAQQQQQDQPPVADVAPPPEPKSRRSAAKSDARASAPRDAEPFPTPVDDPNAAPPKMKKPKRTRITAPPPDAEPAQQAPAQAQPRQAVPPPAQQQSAPSAFPAPLPSGGFAR